LEGQIREWNAYDAHAKHERPIAGLGTDAAIILKGVLSKKYVDLSTGCSGLSTQPNSKIF
jgi:hypothetical protein